MPIPQEKMTLVEWAFCPSDKLMKMTFAKGLFNLDVLIWI